MDHKTPDKKDLDIKEEKLRIIFRHPEILSDDEKQLHYKWLRRNVFAVNFAIYVQFPLSVWYLWLSRRNPSIHGHLRRRVFLMPFITAPVISYCTVRTGKLTVEYCKKYLGDLSDEEISNFEVLY